MNEPRPHEAVTPIQRLVRPFQEFADLEASGGLLLIGCTVAALVWANSPFAGSYFHFWHMDLTFGRIGGLLAKPLHFWINDGLMALFFLLVGLEIKREILVGELASFQRAVLPIAAALGGMIVPAAFYLLFNHGGPGAAGWGIPMATDIAFALGVLALLGSRVPTSLKVFLAALAIADDIGAVLVIAFFYTERISWISLGVGGVFFVALLAANRAGVRHLLIYAILGLGLWVAFLQSGIHATVAGVLLAIAIPTRQRTASRAVLTSNESPMLRLEHALIPWNRYLIMPVFALANAGVILGGGAARSVVAPVSLGVICGLVIGKPIGIVLFSWLATRTRLAAMLDGIGWCQIVGVGMLGGIGFTMSLFIANLAFGEAPALETAKVGILVASVVSGIAGAIVLVKRR
ncbi:MAG TPA: Na+/H+ antiporter NhaA [Chthoniobacterales bacterium]|nr:Na+/H+ antiporter NhaA [Chthoniobacterales bacterium]